MILKHHLFVFLFAVQLIIICKAQTPCRENQRCPDLGNGYYQNPILGGDYPDPSVVRVGDDYYLTNSSFNYYPGLLIWHSKDLVNWEPVAHALHKYVGSVYAPDLLKYKDKYYIYFPANKTNWVVTASSPEGPWSEPVDLKIPGIDPGHIVGRDGKRYLHLSGGGFVQLSEDGLSTVGEVKKVYDGWSIPDSLDVECFCLESPKVSFRNGYYYLTVAEGGTAGPATSHLVVSARSKSPAGPWENSPYNPVVSTKSKKETWWSKGHGTLIEDTKGNSWIMFHGYENGYRTLGRQTLLEPIKWTDDQWFHVPDSIKTDEPIRKPTGEKVTHGIKLSDDFSSNKLGLQWQFFKDYEPERIQLKEGSLFLSAKGTSLSDCAPLLCIPVNHSYSLQVEVEIPDEAIAGLTLYYNQNASCGIAMNKNNLYVIRRDRTYNMGRNMMGSHGFLKLVNKENEVSMYFSSDGKDWKKADKSIEVSGYDHNTFGEFLSLRSGLFAFGKGQVRFDNFIYQGL
jgi:xylan 1,4-beta-xylosidase